MVTVYVEIVPTDTVKYEIDKISGYLKVDRPQQFSNVCPTLYGFVPRTYCAERVAERTGRPRVEIAELYGRDEAHEVIRRSQQDYAAIFGQIEGVLRTALRD